MQVNYKGSRRDKHKTHDRQCRLNLQHNWWRGQETVVAFAPQWPPPTIIRRRPVSSRN